ncbi:MAG: hypothetical protein U9Q07_03500 [Planctomycetota bacterium]|nr:hypothetical protein [Planctomycetota bacterium]
MSSVVLGLDGVSPLSDHTTMSIPCTWTMHLTADGSFFVKAPADLLLYLQILDSNRLVVSNRLFRMYARPGEAQICVGL